MGSEIRDLHAVRAAHRHQRIVFASGGFDLTHAGHLLFFERCKLLGEILVVGVASDATRRKERGPSRPIIPEQFRLKMVGGLKPVNYVFLINQLAQDGEHPLAPLEPILKELEPDIWAMNDDGADLTYRQKLLENTPKTQIVVFPKKDYPEEYHLLSATTIISRIMK
jgi:cytidyltransferase-like protein